MAAKYTLAPVPTGDSRAVMQPRAAVQLSDGSLVQSYYDASVGYYRVGRFTGDRTGTPQAIADSRFDANRPVYAITRDDLDNLYVFSQSNTTGYVDVTRFIKGGSAGSPTWALAAAAPTVVQGVGGQSSYNVWRLTAAWVTGAGSAAGGQLVFYAQLGRYDWTATTVIDVPDKTGAAAMTVRYSNTHQQQGTNTTAFAGVVDMRQDGFGVPRFLITYPLDTQVSVGVMFLTIDGSSTPNYSANVGGHQIGSASRGLHTMRVGAGRFIVLWGNGGQPCYAAAAYEFGVGQLTGGTPGILAATNLNIDTAQGLSDGYWTAFADARVNGKAVVLARNPTQPSPTTQEIRRLTLTLSGSVLTWDTATTVEDTITVPTTHSRGYYARGLHDAAIGTVVDWQWTFMNGGGDSFVTYGSSSSFNQLPNAPTITAPAPGGVLDRAQVIRVAATHSDPDGNPQAGLKVQYRVAGTSGLWTELVRSDAVPYIDVPAYTLAGNVLVRAATSDGYGFGAFSTPVAFVASDTSVGAASTQPPRVDPLQLLNLTENLRVTPGALAVVATVTPLTITLPATHGGATVPAQRHGGYTPAGSDVVEAELIGDVWVVRDKVT